MTRRSRRSRGRSTAYKLCSLLLQYPDGELLAARQDLVGAVMALPRSPAAAALRRFCEWWRTMDPLALEQHYVETFDLDKRSGLYLTFYDQGDKRDRGMALLRLKRLYRAAGLPLEGSELPDYLPVMLEFASDAPDGDGELVLREHRAALELVAVSLRGRGTPYVHVIDAVRALAGQPTAADRARAVKLAAAGPPQELVGLEPFAPAEVTPSSGARR
jgi:nitrate reductase delta subunit